MADNTNDELKQQHEAVSATNVARDTTDNAADSPASNVVKEINMEKITDIDVTKATKEIDINNMKDISDFYCMGGNVDLLIQRAEPGLIYLARFYKHDREGFYNFALEAGRKYRKAEMAEMFFYIRGERYFDEAWLDAVEKTALSAPAEDVLMKEVSAEHQIIYSDNLGFHEYIDGAWKFKTDSEIGQYFTEKLGQHTKGTLVESVIKAYKKQRVKMIEFNKTPVFNFRNGTLELDTGLFRKARPEDYCTMQVSYDYDKEAKCPLYKKFLAEVTDGDNLKIAILNEIGAYVLFTDCALQKSFILLGDGANGKSVYLDVLTAVYGEDNVSNVELSDIADPYQAIALLYSILNVGSETRNIMQSADKFKQFVVGDKVTACKKYKDFQGFRSRAKLVFGCNEMPRIPESNRGMLRRMLFIKFTRHFVPVPAEGELKADPYLTRKLLTELSGIFNLFYNEYKKLKVKQKFTETLEQAQLLLECQEANDTVLAFLHDEKEEELRQNEGEFERKTLYSRYRAYCEENGHKYPANNKTFMKNLRRNLEQMNFGIEERKSGNARFISFKKKASPDTFVKKYVTLTEAVNSRSEVYLDSKNGNGYIRNPVDSAKEAAAKDDVTSTAKQESIFDSVKDELWTDTSNDLQKQLNSSTYNKVISNNEVKNSYSYSAEDLGMTEEEYQEILDGLESDQDGQ